ncbi:cyclic nucleotide-binding domain-containing protein [Thiolapillus sp.]
MNKPDIERVRKLILEAPIGKYIGEEGAQILAERACCEELLKDGEFLFHQGDSENSFYIVAEGRLALVKERKKGKRPRILHVLEKGDLVGELSFIDDTPHTTSVMALGDAAVLRFKAEDIRPLITEHPQMMFDFMRAVIKRVHHTLANIGKQQMALADYISTAGKGRL